MNLIQKSGRNIRLNIFYVSICLGGIAMFFGSGNIVFVGLLLTAASLIYVWFGVNCPNCGCKWVLHFMRTSKSSDWLHDLSNMKKCPKCEYE